MGVTGLKGGTRGSWRVDFPFIIVFAFYLALMDSEHGTSLLFEVVGVLSQIVSKA